MIVNETETITNCMNSEGVISDETIIANHPWTKEVNKEIENKVKDQERTLQMNSQYTTTQSNYGNGANE